MLNGWTFEKLFPSGYWEATNIVAGQLRRFRADTKAGAQRMARDFMRSYRDMGGSSFKGRIVRVCREYRND